MHTVLTFPSFFPFFSLYGAQCSCTLLGFHKKLNSKFNFGKDIPHLVDVQLHNRKYQLVCASIAQVELDRDCGSG